MKTAQQFQRGENAARFAILPDRTAASGVKTLPERQRLELVIDVTGAAESGSEVAVRPRPVIVKDIADRDHAFRDRATRRKKHRVLEERHRLLETESVIFEKLPPERREPYRPRLLTFTERTARVPAADVIKGIAEKRGQIFFPDRGIAGEKFIPPANRPLAGKETDVCGSSLKRLDRFQKEFRTHRVVGVDEKHDFAGRPVKPPIARPAWPFRIGILDDDRLDLETAFRRLDRLKRSRERRTVARVARNYY